MKKKDVVIEGPVPWEPMKKVGQGRATRRFIPEPQATVTERMADHVKARIAAGEVIPFDAGVALELSCVFWIPRPAYHYGTGRNHFTLKPRYRDARPTGKPDLTNLSKLLEDAMRYGGLIPDDKQIVGTYSPFAKRYVTGRMDEPRSVVRVREVR